MYLLLIFLYVNSQKEFYHLKFFPNRNDVSSGNCGGTMTDYMLYTSEGEQTPGIMAYIPDFTFLSTSTGSRIVPFCSGVKTSASDCVVNITKITGSEVWYSSCSLNDKKCLQNQDLDYHEDVNSCPGTQGSTLTFYSFDQEESSSGHIIRGDNNVIFSLYSGSDCEKRHFSMYVAYSKDVFSHDFSNVDDLEKCVNKKASVDFDDEGQVVSWKDFSYIITCIRTKEGLWWMKLEPTFYIVIAFVFFIILVILQIIVLCFPAKERKNEDYEITIFLVRVNRGLLSKGKSSEKVKSEKEESRPILEDDDIFYEDVEKDYDETLIVNKKKDKQTPKDKEETKEEEKRGMMSKILTSILRVYDGILSAITFFLYVFCMNCPSVITILCFVGATVTMILRKEDMPIPFASIIVGTAFLLLECLLITPSHFVGCACICFEKMVSKSERTDAKVTFHSVGQTLTVICMCIYLLCYYVTTFYCIIFTIMFGVRMFYSSSKDYFHNGDLYNPSNNFYSMIVFICCVVGSAVKATVYIFYVIHLLTQISFCCTTRVFPCVLECVWDTIKTLIPAIFECLTDCFKGIVKAVWDVITYIYEFFSSGTGWAFISANPLIYHCCNNKR